MDLLSHAPRPVVALGRALADGGHDAVLVGGAVRDALLGRDHVREGEPPGDGAGAGGAGAEGRGVAVRDWDLVTDADPARLRVLAEAVPGVRTVYDLGERFGTVGVAIEGGHRLEVTRLRSEALAAPSPTERFAIDAGHRDFTVNSLGLDLTSGTLLDPTRGRDDLAARLLRAPGDPHARFAEDPLRVLRAARFVAELGFGIESATLAAMPVQAPRLSTVAPERVREELAKLLVGDHAGRGLRTMCDTGSLSAVLPEVAALDGVSQPSFHDLDVLAHTIQAVESSPPRPILRWATLLHDVGKAATRTVEESGRIRFFRHAQEGAVITEAICRRLRMSVAETEAIVHLVAEHMRLGDVDFDNPRSVDRAVRKLDLWVGAGAGARRLASAEDAVELTIADFAATAHRADAPALRQALTHAVRDSRRRGTRPAVVSPVDGRELMREFGLAEGERIGVAKRAIENAITSCEIGPDDRDGALRVARKALEEG